MSHIKLHGVKNRIQYEANGTLTTYEFPFVIFSDTDIQVYLNDVLQSSETYSVMGIKNANGGSITFTTPPTIGTVITITRDLSIERTTDFQEGGALRADTLNNEFDYQTACLQQVADSINRSMILPPYATDMDVDLTLPTPSAGRAIVWNSDGTNLENSSVKINELEGTLLAYKEIAENASAEAISAADSANEKALEATVQASSATIQAQIAAQKADEVSHALSVKASTDMDNLTEDGTAFLIRISFPSTSYVDLSLGASDSEYTAPANGYYYICKSATSKQFIDIRNLTVNYRKSSLSSNDNQCIVIMPVQKDDIVKIKYTATGALEAFRFIYAQGEI